jgi:hypothetical protein
MASDGLAAARPAAPVAERKAVMPFHIGPVKPVGTRKLNLLVYGPYGHGKTTFVASALDVASMNDILFIAAEPGDMSITNRRTLDIVQVNEYRQIARIFEYLTLHVKWRNEGNTAKLLEWEKQLKDTVIPLEDQTKPVKAGRTWFEEQRLRTGKPMDEPYLYNTVILDSISELYKYLIYKFTGIDIGKTKLDEEIEKMEEWQAAQELFSLFIRSFRDLDLNSLFVSAENIEPERRNNRHNPLAGQARPQMAGQMGTVIAGHLDIVGYLILTRDPEEGDVRRMYLGAGYPGWLSKHRFQNLPDLEYVDNPTLSSLIDLARKDAELNGTSSSTPVRRNTTEQPIAPTHHATRPAASHSRVAATGQKGTSASGRRGDAVRRH